MAAAVKLEKHGRRDSEETKKGTEEEQTTRTTSIKSITGSTEAELLAKLEAQNR